ncbi:histidine--tRNA ligase [Zavarzinia aquatilis]|uniref:Histidine--tRNA ligase n=1 Tax=Zavarzinia aquatilis TaxID=2211142 RepID=A0A317EH94_9PROT|nr:histidine--tRNA ligase [Zavarzinia aquatilis]PWR24793.1 histidine--tRNA ligase [Zavarzinia aquatilis]
MAALQPVRGTHDLIGEEARRHDHIVRTFKAVAHRYGFQDISTPIFEFSEVFHRTLGETSDVVSKETYTFTDRGGESLTLRPEMTAGIARAFISGGLAKDLPLKLCGHGPMFRYERPQKGRLRQFHQVDAEVLGVPEPQADIEVLALGADFLGALGLGDRVELKLNTLGDTESRQNYRQALINYFSAYKEQLSEDSLKRLDRNPMRILDSKDEGDRKLVADAPRLHDYLNEASRTFFDKVRRGLDALGIGYTLDERLVRGLDYYSHTAWEFVTTDLGAQGTVLGGGRYDGLIALMGGPQTAGIGFAAGIERLAMMIEPPAAPARAVAIVPIGEAAELPALQIARRLRQAGYTVEQGYRGNVGKRLERASKAGARVAILIGDDEIAAGVVKCRDLDTRAETMLAIDSLETALADHR